MRILVNDFSGHAFQLELSRELARRGHTVQHIYFADNLSTPKGNLVAGVDLAGQLTIEGLHIPIKFSKHSLLHRRQADIAYGRSTAERLDRFKPEIVLSSNMPLDGQRILAQAARQHQARFYFWLQDVYSSAIRFVFKRKLGPLASLAGGYYERLERQLLRNSNGVICISPGFRQVVEGWGIAPERTRVIENWAPLGEVQPTPRQNEWAREHGVERKFCFMYSGTLGMKHRPELLLALARELEQRSDARLVVIAAGPGADWLRRHAAGIGPETLQILDFQPYNRLSEVLGSADVLLALLDSEAGAFAVPSKVLSYLCAGRALLLAAPAINHAAGVVRQAQAGLVTSPDDAQAFVQAALRLKDEAPLRQGFAQAGRAWAERNFSIGPIAGRFEELFTIV